MKPSARMHAERLVHDTSYQVDADLVAAYLHGSAAGDDFVPGRSDLDVLVVLEQQLPDPTVAGLVEAAGAVGRSAGMNVDFRLVTKEAARNADRHPLLEAGISVRLGREPDAVMETRRAVEVDLLNEFSLCRDHSVPIVGHDAAEVLFDVPSHWVVEIGLDQIQRWRELPFESTYADLMVFTSCRIWQFATEGVHASKSGAARWVRNHHPDLEAPQISLDRRNRGVRTEPGEQAVRALLTAVLADLSY
jgi:predicted nucleotidyltransferase